MRELCVCRQCEFTFTLYMYIAGGQKVLFANRETASYVLVSQQELLLLSALALSESLSMARKQSYPCKKTSVSGYALHER